jgi:putative Mg2+ transporter-C (MgtC) family protein
MSELEGILRIGIAAVLGGTIGFERETLNKPAGLRTHMLVSLGAAMFMVIALLIVADYGGDPVQGRIDPTRIGSTIVTGIGFLGGGIIFRTQDRIRGLTTAAGLWVAAAIGMAVGGGYYVLAIGGTVLSLVVLVIMRELEPLTPVREDADDTSVPTEI